MDNQTRMPDFVLQRLRKVERERQGQYAPEVEGIKSCIRCGKPLRVIEVKGESFQVEVAPVEWDAELGRLVVKYDMHFPTCVKEKEIETTNS